MIPLLPFVPNTISPVCLSPEDRLTFLRRLDTYERKTTPERELEKSKLENEINKETR